MDAKNKKAEINKRLHNKVTIKIKNSRAWRGAKSLTDRKLPTVEIKNKKAPESRAISLKLMKYREIEWSDKGQNQQRPIMFYGIHMVYAWETR